MSILLSLLLLVSPVFGDGANCQDLRFETAIAYRLSDSEGVFETQDGYLWGAYGDFETDKGYVLVFDTNGTPNIFDDRVVGVLPMGMES